MNSGLAIGIDIGGTNSVVGLVNNAGEIISESKLKTTAYESFDSFVEAIADLIAKLTEGHELNGIGVGAPNGNYYTGTIEQAPNLPWKGVLNLQEKLASKTGLKTIITNDANAAAQGEKIFGDAKAMKHYLMITLGTGLGSGIVVDGKIVYGHDGFAGEIGHIIANPNGRDCNCGRKGCVETYASATGICRTVSKLLADRRIDSSLRDVSFADLTSKQITAAALQGDEVAKEAFEYTAKILGVALANAIAILSPEAIFLFGGLTKAGDLLFDPLKESIDSNVLKIFRGKTKILPSGIQGKNAAVLGAASLVY